MSPRYYITGIVCIYTSDSKELNISVFYPPNKTSINLSELLRNLGRNVSLVLVKNDGSWTRGFMDVVTRKHSPLKGLIIVHNYASIIIASVTSSLEEVIKESANFNVNTDCMSLKMCFNYIFWALSGHTFEVDILFNCSDKLSSTVLRWWWL